MKYQIARIGFTLSLSLLIVMSVWAQQAQSPRSGAAGSNRGATGGNTSNTNSGGGGVNPNVIMSADEDYHLAPSDVIEVIVDDAQELSVSYRINKSGIIPLRYLGNTNISGMTCDEVSKLISDGLRGRYLKDPKVYVSVKQYNSRSFFIQGAVRSPGVYVIEGKPSLFKLITIAGGLQENHGLTAYIFRETKASPEKLETGGKNGLIGDSEQAQLAKIVANAKGTDSSEPIEGDNDFELITANIGGILRGRLESNTYIQPSDVVYIPPASVFYVAGEVNAPGQYQLRQGITLRQAISLAQGHKFKARLDKGKIFREDPLTGKLTEIPVDIKAVLDGKKDDIALLPNDVIHVPNSLMRSVSQVMLTALGTSAAYRIPMGR